MPFSPGAAVVGLGVGEAHARAYAAHPRCELRLLFDLNPRRARTLARALGAEVASSFKDVVEDSRVDVVSVASYDDCHAAEVLALLEAGKHVFVEKPLCRTPAEFRRIRRAWEKAGRPHLASNLVLRAAPLYRRILDPRKKQRLGEIYAFDGDYLYGRLHKITAGWRGRVADYSVMLGGGIHLVDLMLACFGETPVSVFATGNRIVTRGTRFRYPDFVAALFRFPSGRIGRITAHFGCVHPHQHVVRVFGTKATLLYDDAGPRLHLRRDPRRKTVLSKGPFRGARPLTDAPLPATKGDLIPGFVEKIVAGCDPAEDFEREAAVLAACFAADRSLRTGREVEVRAL